MKKYVNFYENMAEARRRLLNTVVLYDGKPYHILGISDHFGDEVFRAYLEPLDENRPLQIYRNWKSPLPLFEYPSDYPGLGEMTDKWMEDNKGSPLLRKKLNSPKFNRFRPFPLGMCNSNGDVYYIARKPQRRGDQGLTQNALEITKQSLQLGKTRKGSGLLVTDRYPVNIFSQDFASTVEGMYPTAEECCAALNDEGIANTGAAFNRDFAFIRGPLNGLYVAYKTDIVGVLPNSNLDSIILDKTYKHLVECIDELGLFKEVLVK